ncbi:unnamed protein product [Prorocentrum cordatum]|uniref:cellulase n=1 Tax=Prorocentrum cordatum TaxID=2364126 RepID=A0ABN9R4Q4_9DINO|nr:unnamed protein product [Polarella glacialis]
MAMAGGTAPARMFAAALVVARAQMRGDLSMEECTPDGACTSTDYSVVLDMSWRWMHNVGGYTNCIGEADHMWSKDYCPDAATCAKKCAVEGLNSTQYSETYGIEASKDASSLTLKYVPGSREYLMFQLKNREFTFDIDLSTLPCGTNAALYLIEMAPDGGGSDAGAAYGAGYCDAQCPQGMKFINNKDWGMTLAESPEYEWVEVGPVGKYGACCAEFDILEANNKAIAITSHPCTIEGLQTCSSDEECGNKSKGLPGYCDKDGCGLNPYRLGEPTFYGPGREFTLDTSKPFTVITQFVTEDGTDEGAIVDIRRKYVQGGQVIDNAIATALDEAEQGNSLTDDLCTAIVKKFNVTKKSDKLHKAKKSRTWMDTFKMAGGSKAMGEAIGRGMVMSMSVWDDGLGRMNWLDSEKTLIDEDINDPGVARGPCAFEDGDPKKLRAENKQAYVTFSNLRVGPIGSALAATAAALGASAVEAVGDLVVPAAGADDAVTAAAAPEPVLPSTTPASTAPPTTPAAPFTPTGGCEWIPEDDCVDVNEFACGCRRDNPGGPCTPCGPNMEPSAPKAALFELPSQPSARGGKPAAGAAALAALCAAAAGAAVVAAAAAARRGRRRGAQVVQLLAGDEEATAVE